MENGHGPAANLRQTPGRRADRRAQTFVTPQAIIKGKSTRKKRSSNKKAKKKVLKEPSNGLENEKGNITQQPSVSSYFKTKSVVKALLPEFNNSERDYPERVSVIDRIKRFEEGYHTDPENCSINTKITVLRKMASESKIFASIQQNTNVSTDDYLPKWGSGDYYNNDKHAETLSSPYDNSDSNKTLVYTCFQGVKRNSQDAVQTIQSTGYVNIKKDQVALKANTVWTMAINTNNRFQILATSGNDSDATIDSCIVEDCNYAIGEIEVNNRCLDNLMCETNSQVTSFSQQTMLATTVSTSVATLNTATCLTYVNPVSAMAMGTQQPRMGFITASGKTNPWFNSTTTATLHSQQVPTVVSPTQQRLPAVIPMPADMDMSKMFQMLTHISPQVAAGTKETVALRQDMSAYNGRTDQVAQDVEDQGQLLKKTISSFNKRIGTVQILSDITTQQEKEINQLKAKIENFETNVMRNKITISGIQESVDEDTSRTVLEFFKVKLLIDNTIPIVYARRIGMARADSKTYRVIEVALQNIKDKAKIYKHTKNLKGVTNDRKQSYQLRDMLPEKRQEEDNRRRQMIRDNKAKAKQNTAHHIDMSVKNNQLLMNNQVYRKKVSVPTAKELLTMTDEDRESTNGMSSFNCSVQRKRKSISSISAGNRRDSGNTCVIQPSEVKTFRCYTY